MDPIESARQSFLNNQVEQAVAALDAILANEASYSEDALFDARCIRGSIASLRGPKDDPYLATLRPKSRTEGHIKAYLDATAQLRSGQFIGALAKLQGLVREDPHFLAARMGLAAAYVAQKQWNEAFQQYSEVLATTGKDAPAIVRVGLAICSMRRGEFEHAKKCLQRALAIEPNDDLACMAMAVVQLQQRDGPSAAETIKRLYGLSPESPIVVQKFADLVFFKGITTGRLGDVAHAIRDLVNTAITLDAPNERTREGRHRAAYAKFQLGRLAHCEGSHEAAVALYNEAVSVLGTSCTAALLYLAKAYYQLGKEHEAVQCLERLEADRKADKEVLTMLISHHETVGNHVRAMHYCQKLADEFGIGDPKSHWLRAFAARHNTSNALRHLAIAKAIPNQPIPATAIHTEAFLRAQQPATAGAALGEMLSALQKIRNEPDEQKVLSPTAVTEALNGAPELLPHYYNIACAMASSSGPAASASASSSTDEATRGKRLQTAQKVFVAIIKAVPTFADPYYRLAELFIAHKHFAAAQKWLALLLHVRPNDGHALTMLAKLYFDGKNSRIAVETLRRGMAASDDNDTTAGLDPAADAAKEAQRNASLIPSMALGSLLLWSAQQPSEKAPRHLLGAKECFSRPLRADSRNALAAHGLACAVGFGGNSVSKGARSELTENTLSTVRSTPLNDPSLQAGAADNMVNCMTRSHSYKRVIDQLLPHLDKLNAPQIGTLGYSLAADGQLAAATSVLQKGLERFPTHHALRYNRILVTYARITKEIGTGAQISEERGREIRSLIVLASDLSHEYVSLKHSGTEMGVAAFTDAQSNVRAMAKQLVRLEECLHYAVRRSVLQKKFLDAKQNEWREQAVKSAAEEARAAAEAEEARLEAQRLVDETSRRRMDALQQMRANRTGEDEGEYTNAMVTGAMELSGYAGEVLPDVPPMTAEEAAEAIDSQAFAV